mmetsp:Transcript_4471/g.5642  ORF Transcript_4471/g.5642 Transcript_4471/m.5642 type:complete len:87 (+) Transcript_4471:336-596(+)
MNGGNLFKISELVTKECHKIYRNTAEVNSGDGTEPGGELQLLQVNPCLTGQLEYTVLYVRVNKNHHSTKTTIPVFTTTIIKNHYNI